MSELFFDLQRFDDIFNNNSNTLISGTSGNDSIYNQYTTNVTIQTGAGSDTVFSWGGQKGTIEGGAGNDYIHIGHWIITDDNWFYGSQNLLRGGAGNDSIRNWGASATINGGSGNDSLLNYGEYSTIIGGTGNDTIYNNWDFSTNAPHSEDYAWNALFKYSSGDGNDIIYGFKADSTLSISGGSYSTTKSGDNIIVTVDDGKISLIGAASLSKVNIKFKETATSKTLSSSANYTSLVGSSGNDSLYNRYYDYVTIVGNAGNDTITNDYGEKVSIVGGDGNDSIINDWVSHSTTINGGAGNDSIFNYWGDSLKISGGAGNDYIYLWHYTDRSNKTLIKYSSGDGNDTISGFDSNDTLSISGGSYSTTASGNDVLVKVGNDTINLKYAYATADTLHINGEAIKLNRKAVKLTDSNETIEATRDSISIDLGAGNDSIMSDGDNLTITGGKGNDTISNSFSSYHSKNTLIKYTEGDGNDYVTDFNADDTLSIAGSAYSTKTSDSNLIVTVGKGKITLAGVTSANIKFKKTSSKVSIPSGAYTYNGHSYYLFDKSLTWTKAKAYCESIGGHLAVITSAGEQSAIQTLLSNKGSKDSYWLGGRRNSSGSFKWVTGESFSYTNWGSGEPNNTDEDAIMIFKAVDSMSPSKFGEWNDLSSSGAAGYSRYYGLDNLGFICEWDTVTTSGGNSKLITLTEGNDTYNNSVKGATINALGGNDSIKNIRPSAKIYGGDGADTIVNETGTNESHAGSYSTIEGGDGNDYIENMDYCNYANVNGGAGNDTIKAVCGGATIIGGTGKDSIYCFGWGNSVNGGEGDDIIVGAGFNRDGNSHIFNGGEGNDTIINGKIYAGESWDSKNVTIIGGTGNDLISLGSNAKNNVIKYSSGDGNDKIYGFKADSTLSIGGGSYSTTKSGSNLIVTVGEGKITLAGVTSANIKGTKTFTEKNSWRLSGTTATFGTSSKTLFKVTGVKSADGLSVKNKVITVAASSLNQSNVTITGNGYKLALGNDVNNTSTTSNAWSYKNSVATLKQTRGEKYSLANDAQSISYSAGTSTTLAKLSGVKSANGLSVKKKVITVAQASLNQANVTLTGDGYKLKLANDVNNTSTTSNAWSYKNSVATLKQTRGEKYSLANDAQSISYTAGTSTTLAKLSGVKSKEGLSVSGKVITVPNKILSSKKVTVTGSGYEFQFAAQKTAITGSKNADIITSTGASSTINAGKGNDSINVSGANNVIVYKNGDGKDTITNYSADDTIKITSGTAKATTSGSDVVFTVGKGSILLKGAADKTVSYIAGGTEHTFFATSSDEPYTASGKGVTLPSSYSKELFDVSEIANGDKVVTIDASAVTHKLKIIGNNLANSIAGGAGNNTLRGGEGDDTLSGGKGSDVFIYYDGDGNDTITNYAAKDEIRIYGSASVSTLKSNVVLSVGKGKITVKDAHENKIGVTYVEDGIEHDYINGEQTATFTNDKKTTLKLTKSYWKDSVDFANFGESLQTLDAMAITHELKITGNDKANQILGSSTKANTITGGGGNDTLQGGSKADLFIYTAGDDNDKIVGYEANDIISIVSGIVDYNYSKEDETVVLKIGNGNISVTGAAGKYITYYDNDGKHQKYCELATPNVVEDWFVADDNNFLEDNNLSALVQSKAADYSLAEVETSLSSGKDLTTLTYSSKK